MGVRSCRGWELLSHLHKVAWMRDPVISWPCVVFYMIITSQLFFDLVTVVGWTANRGQVSGGEMGFLRIDSTTCPAFRKKVLLDFARIFCQNITKNIKTWWNITVFDVFFTVARTVQLTFFCFFCCCNCSICSKRNIKPCNFPCKNLDFFSVRMCIRASLAEARLEPGEASGILGPHTTSLQMVVVYEGKWDFPYFREKSRVVKYYNLARLGAYRPLVSLSQGLVGCPCFWRGYGYVRWG